MELINKADIKLEGIRKQVIREIDIRVKKILDHENKKILFVGHTIDNPYRDDESYLYLTEIFLNSNFEVITGAVSDIEETENTFPVSLDRIGTFDLLVILRNLVREEGWCVFKTGRRELLCKNCLVN